MALSMMNSDPQLDHERRAALRRMRSIAVGLLLFAAAVYFLTLDREGFLGFVNAAAEASMVGAIADWFAVVALFKHPLGIPVPHTALVSKRKDMFGKGLEEFVSENFLQEEIIRSRVLGAEPGRKAGDWLSQEKHARRVVLEGADLLRITLARIRDEDIAEFINAVMVPRFLEEPISPLAGSLLHEVVADGAHQGFVDLLLEESHRWLTRNEDTFYDVVAERAPWWAPEALNERVIPKLHAEMVDWLVDIRNDPDHRSRRALDKLLIELADGLLHDPDTIERMERFKERVLAHPQVSVTFISLWNALRRAFVAALEDPEGDLVKRGVTEVMAFGGRLQEDDGLRGRIDERAASLVVFMVGRYGRELTTVITSTIDQWDGEEASRKIELHVGKDLQFIRINGTIVGGLVGLVIHTFAVVAA
jgi:uncharacterized membrane-anchored protein YjiN (DUF445 family)